MCVGLRVYMLMIHTGPVFRDGVKCQQLASRAVYVGTRGGCIGSGGVSDDGCAAAGGRVETLVAVVRSLRAHMRLACSSCKREK